MFAKLDTKVVDGQQGNKPIVYLSHWTEIICISIGQQSKLSVTSLKCKLTCNFTVPGM